MSNVDVLEATESFAWQDPKTGKLYQVGAGSTRVASDHLLAQQFPQHFRPIEDALTYRTEEATAEPDRPRQRAIPRRPQPAHQPQEPTAEKPASPETTHEEPVQPRPPGGLTTQSLRKEDK